MTRAPRPERLCGSGSNHTASMSATASSALQRQSCGVPTCGLHHALTPPTAQLQNYYTGTYSATAEPPHQPVHGWCRPGTTRFACGCNAKRSVSEMRAGLRCAWLVADYSSRFGGCRLAPGVSSAGAPVPARRISSHQAVTVGSLEARRRSWLLGGFLARSRRSCERPLCASRCSMGIGW